MSWMSYARCEYVHFVHNESLLESLSCEHHSGHSLERFFYRRTSQCQWTNVFVFPHCFEDVFCPVQRWTRVRDELPSQSQARRGWRCHGHWFPAVKCSTHSGGWRSGHARHCYVGSETGEVVMGSVILFRGEESSSVWSIKTNSSILNRFNSGF